MPDAPPASFAPVVSVAHAALSTAFDASVSSAPSAASAPVASPVLEGFRAHVAQLSRIQQDYVLAQQALHERFLSGRGAAMETFLHAARLAGTTESRSAPTPGLAATTPAPPEARATPMSAAAPASPATSSASPSVEAPRPEGGPVGPRFDRGQLEIHAGGRISEIFGSPFAAQDGYERQVRMPLPPLLLADRVVGLAAEPASMGKGTIWTETDVTWDSWYLHQGHMPAGVMIEAGQADLMLISYLGVDLLNRGERVYRLLGCELTYHGDLPRAGETLRFGIHLDGHAAQDAVRLMFFHYDCTNGDRLQLTVRKGQAGFFTDAELAASAGCLWSPETQAIVPAAAPLAPGRRLREEQLRQGRPRRVRPGRRVRLLRPGIREGADAHAQPAHPGRADAPPGSRHRLRRRGRTVGPRVPARGARRPPGPLVLRRPLQERPVHARDADVRGVPAGDGVLPRGARLHAAARRLAVPARLRPAVPAPVPRPGDPVLAPARHGGVRRGGRRRPGPDALRRPPLHGRRPEGVPRAARRARARPRLASRGDAGAPRRGRRRHAADGRGRRLPLRPGEPPGLRVGEAVEGLRADLHAVRRAGARRPAAGAALSLHEPRDGRGRPDRRDEAGGVGHRRVRRAARRLVLRRERLPDDAVRRPPRGGAPAVRLALELRRLGPQRRRGARLPQPRRDRDAPRRGLPRLRHAHDAREAEYRLGHRDDDHRVVRGDLLRG